MTTHFETYVAKYGELSAYSLMELWERMCGIRHPTTMLLEERWAFFLRETDKHLAPCAAAPA